MKEILIYPNTKCTVDDEDFERISKFSWHSCKGGNGLYARTGYNRETKLHKKCLMHRMIMNMKDSRDKIDHVDGNGLNNQKSNLRKCSDSQNMFNRAKNKNTSSKYKGVTFISKENEYMVRYGYKRKVEYVGRYDNEVEAALAYNCAASFAFREFARLNKIES